MKVNGIKEDENENISPKRAKIDVKENKSFDVVDEYYFKSYESMDSHYTMLTDTVRTLAYKRAIESMYKILHDSIIVDVGSGTGILSTFCARAGAKKVYAIEANSVACLSRKMIEENKLSDVIEVIHSMAERVELPVKQVDAIVSEWMGYCLLCENMLPSVLSIRDKYLRKGGLMFPCTANLFVAGVCSDDDDEKEKQLWQRLSEDYGVDLTGSVYENMQQSVVDNAIVGEMPPKFIVTRPSCALTIDLYTAQPDEVRFLTGKFNLDCLGNVRMSHLVFWFTTTFPDGSVLSTSPFHKLTHWNQTIVKLPKQFNITQHCSIFGTVRFSPAGYEKRSICIGVDLEHWRSSVREDKVHFESFL